MATFRLEIDLFSKNGKEITIEDLREVAAGMGRVGMKAIETVHSNNWALVGWEVEVDDGENVEIIDTTDKDWRFRTARRLDVSPVLELAVA